MINVDDAPMMESPSPTPCPVPSTPISGLSLHGKWTFHSCTPAEDGVRKKLFELEAAAADDDNQWSSSSEYFSQSAHEASCLSGESQTNLFDENSPFRPEAASEQVVTKSGVVQ